MSNWVPVLTEIISDSSNFTARIVWVNNTEGKKVGRDYLLTTVKTIEQFNSTLRNDRDGLDTNVNVIKTLSSEVGQELDITAPVINPIPPTDLQIFLTNYNQLLSAQRKIAAGVIDSSAQEYLDIQKLVINTYKPEFVGIG